MPRPSSKPIQLLKGFKDILPEHQDHWEFIRNKAKELFSSHGFSRIDVPILEQTNLYVKGTGKHTDIVEKELYSFEDKGGDDITVRPEFTPGICRAYIEHGMLNKSQPVKLYSLGPVFRHDNPQSGRYRQFHQLNLESIGSESPVIDAELVIIAYRFLEALGLPVEVQINSIGGIEERTEFILKLKQFLQSGGRKKELCDSCKSRFAKNTLRILDCKQSTCQEILSEAPQIVDFLSEDSKKHFMAVLEYLDDLEIKYNLNVKLVRGLDYYNRTTFEIYVTGEDTEKSQGALVGGGRYDGLIEILGGRPTPAAGFAIGIERVVKKLREKQVEIPRAKVVDVFLAQLGVEARKECFKLHQKLLDEKIKVNHAFSKDGLKAQLERADTDGAKMALILGQKELMDNTIIIRDMQSGIQEIINYDKAVDQVKKRIDSALSEVKSYRLDVPGSDHTTDENGDKIDFDKPLKKKDKVFKSSLEIEDDGLLKEDVSSGKDSDEDDHDDQKTKKSKDDSSSKDDES
jgi:histidyl-tRNA synthetase